MTLLVSVMMPCYNSSKTLPLAVASLVAQSYENWECILVDDGSTDNLYDVIEQVNDIRIRFFRLNRNMGRAVARQVALERAKGELLCMLDADDWVYPSKLQRQVEVMTSEPRLALLSSGMAIVNTRNEIVGIRSGPSPGQDTLVCGPMTKPGPPPVAHAPAMIRGQIARQARFDPTFRMGEDADFLLQILVDRYYGVLPDVTYVYGEHASVTLAKIVRSFGYSRRMFRKYRQRFPVASRVNEYKSAAKPIVYRIAFALGLGKWMIRRRSRQPTEPELQSFQLARQSVFAVAERFFPGQALPEGNLKQ